MTISRTGAAPLWLPKRAARAVGILALGALFTLALGCATQIPGLSPISPTANPTAEIDTLASDVEGARTDQLDVLSPSWFRIASDSLKAATSTQAQGEAVQTILRHVSEGRAAIKQARTFAEVSRQTLPAVIKAREDARTAGGAELGSRYARVESRFLELTAGIESDNLNWARRTAPSVEKDFREVELASIKRNTVYRIVDLIAKAKDADASEYAPALLAKVESRYADLDRFISENRYASDAIGTRADEVLFDANRLVHFTDEAKRLARLKPNEIALQNEDTLLALSQKLELPDLRNQSQGSQRRQIENAIDKLLKARHGLQARVDTLKAEAANQRGRIDALQDEAGRERQRLAALEKDRRFNQRFIEVSSLFNPGEAEVYREGSQLVIRVRSIQFPTGSAVVLPDSYPVLAKVQRAIKSFDGAQVVVEGHTDSTGSAEVNDRISQQRADAVLSYLVNNETIGAGSVTAVGMGFSQPLASDRTEAGRAQNRRIDVVIDAGSADPLAGSAVSMSNP